MSRRLIKNTALISVTAVFAAIGMYYAAQSPARSMCKAQTRTGDGISQECFSLMYARLPPIS